ncbi:MAG: hypothetical protein A2289_00480 [Deltaproteobacteria bacterium RIFOXYA12_FULL_58_15]|nr:MAG: hypothetical protein A2289_00480 [Deltaproteobacteria bacterium RIFOXYA12_FULL_58_15]OGR07220.1 MAG: hypothetical protein A2341_11130 [Deltaproteobacteria bacterium RIFOXYB12_FULL_58_9]
MIGLRNLFHRFGDFTLGPLSLSVPDGEYCVILGPSGAGKSLLLQTIAGLVMPNEGQITVGERDVTATAPELRGIGLVFQQSALFPHMSVEENVLYGLRARGVEQAERARRLAQVVERTGTGDLLTRPVATLSGGEAQKVAIARALAVSPDVLLLDEPLSPIDHNTRLSLQRELGRIHRELCLTTVHVTHSREEARALGSCCAIMMGGKIIQAAPTEEVFEKPRCTFVASFLGVDAVKVKHAPKCSVICVRQPGVCDAALEMATPPTGKGNS